MGVVELKEGKQLEPVEALDAERVELGARPGRTDGRRRAAHAGEDWRHGGREVVGVGVCVTGGGGVRWEGERERRESARGAEGQVAVAAAAARRAPGLTLRLLETD